MSINLKFYQVAPDKIHSVFCNGMQEATMHTGIYFYGNSLNSMLFLVKCLQKKKKIN